MRVLDDRPEIWPYILASLIIHAIMLLILPRLVLPARFDGKPIEVYAIPEADFQKQSNPYRIADIPEPAVQQKPKVAKFLGMFDSAVQDETVGTTIKPGKSGEGAKKSGAHPYTREQARKDIVRGGRDKLFAFSKDLFRQKESVFDGEGKSAGEGGAMDDFYPDFRRGAYTYLNVLRYPDVEYFVRMKRAFGITWNPGPFISDYFSRNHVARGSVDVVLGVSVDRSGELKEIFVFRASGISAYDHEALRTVRASAPFASPPEKFLEDDGLLRMSWTFSVYL